MKIQKTKPIWLIVILAIVALVATYSVRAEFDTTHAKIRVKRSTLGINYHTAHWDTWLTQYISSTEESNWIPTELYKDPIFFMVARSRLLVTEFDGNIEDVHRRLMWNQAEQDSLEITADTILRSFKNDTSNETQGSLDCFLQKLPMPSSASDPKISIEEVRVIIDNCFSTKQPE